MKISELVLNDRAVSPMIGVVLMVAITVTLAATAGVFVLNVGQDEPAVPQTRFDYTYEEATNELVVRHDGGDTLTTANSGSVEVQLYDNTPGSPPITATGSFSLSSGISAGDSVRIADAYRGDRVRIVWTAPDGSTTQVISEYEV